MEKKHLVMVWVMMFSMGLNAGCKNESKSFTARDVKVALGSIDRGDDVETLTELEEARFAKTSFQEALDQLAEVKRKEIDAQERRIKLQSVLEDGSDSLVDGDVIIELSTVDSEISALEKEVELSQKLAIAKREILNKELEDLTEVEKAKIGEAGEDFQMAYNTDAGKARQNMEELKIRLEISYEAQKEIVGNQSREVETLNNKLKFKFIEIDTLISQGQGQSDRVKALGIEISEIQQEKEAAVDDLILLTANQENLAESLRNLL